MSEQNVSAHIDLLGKTVKDRITSFKGVCITVSFDLFGCVQAVVKPSTLDKDGKMIDAQWFDVNRLEVTDSVRVMNIPAYAAKPAEHTHGPAEKPETRY